MTYEPLARRYRPRTFEEVVGQTPIVKTLTNAIRERRIHHAYVFSGVRGVGKTTVARIFAKALNCEKGPTPTPCLVCDPCVEITAGRDLDVIEMDAASRTGVDDVRDLIDTTRYAPARDAYKIFIIDEFHMLSKPAFNALLKTLEEPPPRVVFLMATTELHKVLPTVLSRTQQFDFRKVPAHEIADQLAMIAKKEKVKAPRSSFEMLARAADGSVRDAESLLDQAIAFCGHEIDDAGVRTLLGLVPEETVESFFAACAERDAGALIRIIDAALAEGHDLRIFHGGLIEGVRRLLVLRAAQNPSEILGLPAEDEKRLAVIAERFTTESLLRLFSVLAGLEAPLKYSDQPRYLLEAAAIRMAEIVDLTPVEDLIARLDQESPVPGPGSPGGSGSRGAGPTRARVPAGTGAPSAGRSAPSSPPIPARPPSTRRSRGEASGDEDATPDRLDAISDGSDPISDRGVAVPRGTEGGLRSAGAQPAEVMRATAAGGERLSGDAETSAGQAASTSSPPASTTDFTDPDPDARVASADSGLARHFLETVREKAMPLSLLIEHAGSIFLDGEALVLLFEESQAFARKSVDQPAKLAILRAAAKEILGRDAPVEVRGAGPRRDRPAAARPAGGSRLEHSEEARGAGTITAPPRELRLQSDGPRAAQDERSADESPIEDRAGDGPSQSVVQMRVSGFGHLDPEGHEPGPRPSLGGDDGVAAAHRLPGNSARQEADPQEQAAGPRGRETVDPDTLEIREDRDAGADPPALAKHQRLMAEALGDPLLKSLMERFGGRIVDVKEIP